MLSVISTRVIELCIRVLYHRLGCVIFFSDGVPDAGGGCPSRMVPVSGGRLMWLA